VTFPGGDGAEIVSVDPIAPDSAAIRRAAAILAGGGLVAFPTETVYGLGANALDAAAVARIFAAKERPGYNPLIAHVADTTDARTLVTEWPDTAARLAAAFWPGPLTLVLPRDAQIPDIVTAGLPTVAVRVPAHPVARALLAACRVPVAAPSANRFMSLSPTSAAHVARGLGGRVDLILDGGDTPIGIESTVLDLSTRRPTLLRPGIIDEQELSAIVGSLDHAAAPGDESARPSPGMLDRHYAPRAPLHLYADATDAIRIVERLPAAAVVGALPRAPLQISADHVIAMPAEPRAYARLLFAALHSLDAAGCTAILAEAVPDTARWAGIADRLRRAAS
jgi:L-threonylcarbamoyladenylate synthase